MGPNGAPLTAGGYHGDSIDGQAKRALLLNARNNKF